MRNVIVFGAGGRAGRRIVTEARRRGHQVTAVVRDPRRHPDLGAIAGDVTDAGRVAALAAGHHAVVNAAARVDVPTFFPAAARALVGAGAPRLVAIGIGTMLEVAPGVPGYDAPGFPAEHRAFSLGHAAQVEVLRGAGDRVDWVLLVPPPTVLDDAGGGSGRYTTGGTHVLPGGGLFAYADLALAVVDEIDRPQHHRAIVAIGP